MLSSSSSLNCAVEFLPVLRCTAHAAFDAVSDLAYDQAVSRARCHARGVSCGLRLLSSIGCTALRYIARD